MDLKMIGLDLAKAVFQLHGTDGKGHVVMKKQLRRAQMLLFFANLAPCRVAMEACGSSHYWARKLQAFGHSVQLIPPQYVRYHRPCAESGLARCALLDFLRWQGRHPTHDVEPTRGS